MLFRSHADDGHAEGFELREQVAVPATVIRSRAALRLPEEPQHGRVTGKVGGRAGHAGLVEDRELGWIEWRIQHLSHEAIVRRTVRRLA